MPPEQLGRSLAWGRIVIGAALLLAPGAARLWVGEPAATKEGKVLTRALGARDLALGVGLLRSLARDAPGRGWIEGGVLADGADLLGTLIAGDAVPKTGRFGVILAAGSGVAAGAYLAPRLGSPATAIDRV